VHSSCNFVSWFLSIKKFKLLFSGFHSESLPSEATPIRATPTLTMKKKNRHRESRIHFLLTKKKRRRDRFCPNPPTHAESPRSTISETLWVASANSASFEHGIDSEKILSAFLTLPILTFVACRWVFFK